jgi:hypothetical protein
MIKLIDILEDIKLKSLKPQADQDVIQKGFKLTPAPEEEFSTVKYLPKFDNINKELLRLREQFKPYMQSPNKDVARRAEWLFKNFYTLGKGVLLLKETIELERITNKEK